MKSMMIALAAATMLALAPTATFAGDTHSSWTRPDRAQDCNPATGNWLNAANITCAPNASGANDKLPAKR